MAQAGFTPILIYASGTATNVPAAGNLTSSASGAELAINYADGKLYYKDSGGNVQLIASKSGASGDVVGPASATDNAIVRFDGTTGKLVQNSVVTIADSTGDISGVGVLNATTLDATNIEVTNIKAKDGTAAASIADSTGKITVSTELAVDNLNLSGNTLSSTDTNGNIVLDPNGTGDVYLTADMVRIGDSNANATLTTNGTGDLILNTNSGTNSGSITIADGANGDMTLTPDGNGSVIITNAGTSNALRITQIGSGNAILVEDSANPDASPLAVDASGRLLVGATTSYAGLFSNAGNVQISSTSLHGLQNARFANDTFGSDIQLLKSRSATIGAQTIVQSGDVVGNLLFGGSDGTAFITLAIISAQVDGTPGTNDMPGRLTFSTTADGASSPTERMRIDSAGRVGIGIAPATSTGVYVNQATTDAVAYGFLNTQTAGSSTTNNLRAFQTSINTSAASFTLGSLNHYFASQGSLGAGSSVTDQLGFVASSNLTGATNNYGFYSDIASGTGRWNFYANGTAANFLAGKLGINADPISNTSRVIVGGTVTEGVFSSGTGFIGTFGNGVTSRADSFLSFPSVNNTTGTVSVLNHFFAAQNTFSTAVTNQYGYFADASLTGATNNYGFYSDIASGTNRWNFYANGTASNYFAGDMQLDKTVTATGTTGAQTINKNAGTVNFAAAATSLVVTDSRVTANSIIICTVGTNDTTMKSVAAVAGAGSFTLHANAAATAETRVNFLIIN